MSSNVNSLTMSSSTMSSSLMSSSFMNPSVMSSLYSLQQEQQREILKSRSAAIFPQTQTNDERRQHDRVHRGGFVHPRFHHELHLNHELLNLTINHLSLFMFVNHQPKLDPVLRPNCYQQLYATFKLVYKTVELEYQFPTP